VLNLLLAGSESADRLQVRELLYVYTYHHTDCQYYRYVTAFVAVVTRKILLEKKRESLFSIIAINTITAQQLIILEDYQKGTHPSNVGHP